MIVQGEESEGYARNGEDFVLFGNGATGFGSAGDDQFWVDAGGHGLGGTRDDFFRSTEYFRNTDGPIIVTTGEGQDTVSAEIRNVFNGEAEDVYLRVTDFDVTEDMLWIGDFSSPNDVDSFDIRDAPDSSSTDIVVPYTGAGGLIGGIAIIRLESTTGVTDANILVTSCPQSALCNGRNSAYIRPVPSGTMGINALVISGSDPGAVPGGSTNFPFVGGT